MHDSAKHARAALARGKTSEALVYLWTALDDARSTEDPRDLDDVGRLAEQIAQRGGEADRAEAETLLAEVERARGEPGEEEFGTFEVSPGAEGVRVEPGFPEPDFPEDDAEGEEEQAKSSGSPLWGLIGLGVFLFFLIRDVLR